MFKLLRDFKEALCPSADFKDIKNKLQKAFDESLKVRDEEINDLKNEVELLKKRRVCCFCGEVEDLREFGKYLWNISGYPSYYYCHNDKCTNLYIAQLENV